MDAEELFARSTYEWGTQPVSFHQPTVAKLRNTFRRAAMVIAILTISLLPVDAPKGRDGVAAEPAAEALRVGGLPVT